LVPFFGNISCARRPHLQIIVAVLGLLLPTAVSSSCSATAGPLAQHHLMTAPPRLAVLIVAATALVAFGPAAHTTEEPLPSRAAVHAAVAAGARAASASLRPAPEVEGGGLVAKCDYHLLRGQWYDYERLWHTAQTALALVSASSLLDDDDDGQGSQLLQDATAAGRWWKAQQIKAPPTLAGLMNSTDVLPRSLGCITDACNGTEDLGDVSDGAYGVFALSAATGDSSFADAAVASARWQLQHMAVAGQPGLYWNIVNKSAVPPAPLTAIAQPYRTQIEGSLFLQAYRHAGDARLRAGFVAQADATIAHQDQRGLWMEWTPNDNATGYLHLRYNLWYAHSLMDAFNLTKNESYLDGALRTASFYSSKVQRSDGTMYYKTNINGSAVENDLCGSAVGFFLQLTLRLLQTPAVLAQQPAEVLDALRLSTTRSVSWLLANQYPTDHPDPNLAGAFLELDFRHKAFYLGPHSRAVVHRDLGTSFAIPALVAFDNFCAQGDSDEAARVCGDGWRAYTSRGRAAPF
jgi:hypothetical protein